MIVRVLVPICLLIEEFRVGGFGDYFGENLGEKFQV